MWEERSDGSGYPDKHWREAPGFGGGRAMWEERSVGSGYPDHARGPAHRSAPGLVVVRSRQLLPPLPPARNATHASLIRSAWPRVNSYMQESCV
ncbi:hypothetical protein SAMN05216199_2061 [Pedococcus cremeus]|uniref:Uncharacterized protein n=1 Tax=Pedococcus cremeus TaxID=587636 RepID=A0A1H9UQY5_9MICO|nr:hypothetical protein SAMN05216199_2061 [Pedococcus cremeus]